MNKIAIIIPSRLEAKRLPGKPLKIIKNKEMILHVYEAAKASNAGEVYVASPNEKIIELIKDYGGNAIKTSEKHQTGTDRVFEVFKDTLKSKPNIIINLQGDMPNINPKSISSLANYMMENKCDICTLASDLDKDKDKDDPNIVIAKIDVTANHPPRHFSYEGFPTIFWAGMSNKVSHYNRHVFSLDLFI